MKKNSTQLYNEFRSLISSKSNFENQIAYHGFLKDESEQEIIENIKKNKKLNAQQIKNVEFYYSIKYFDEKIPKILSELEQLINSKLDNPINNELKLNFLLDHNRRLNTLNNDVLELIKQYPAINEKRFFDVVGPMIGMFPDITAVSEAKTSSDLLNIFSQIGESITKIKVEDYLDIFDFSFLEMYAVTLNFTSASIIKLGEKLIISHIELLKDDYKTSVNGFPLATKIVRDKNILDNDKRNKKIDYSIITLEDLWQFDKIVEKNKKHYNSIIGILTEINTSFSSPIIKNNNSDKLYWVNIPRFNTFIIRGFIYVCLDEKWINQDISNVQLRQVFLNTFTVAKGGGGNVKNFRNILTDTHEELYTSYLKKTNPDNPQ